ncbi:MAG: hypothetical protein M2R45_00079 [Verrucomicrobia subdivision 3 bacterium]|nr:hypothetical protein [Limisphaerales bacterium]MCS1412463.1 hypothetical protein [Limisphaerales bacterium]
MADVIFKPIPNRYVITPEPREVSLAVCLALLLFAAFRDGKPAERRQKQP